MPSIIKDTERLLVMDLWNGTVLNTNGSRDVYESRTLTVDEMRQVRDTGAETVTNFVVWYQLEKKPGQIDWEETDKVVSRNRETGMKTILMVHDGAPEFFPEDWYMQSVNSPWIGNSIGKVAWSILSPWSRDAQAESNSFIRKLMDRYAAPDVEFACTLGREGESVLVPGVQAWGGKAALESRGGQDLDLWLKQSLCDYIVATQSQFPVKWVMLHRAFGYDSGNFIDLIYPKLGGDLMGVSWTYWPHAGLTPIIDQDINRYGIRSFAGAEWVEGLALNGPHLKEHPLQGLIVGPIHPYSGHDKLESWMTEAMKRFIDSAR